VRSVLGSWSSKGHDTIVTRALAFRAQPALRDPDEGVEPVERTHESGDELKECITARDVRQLVPKHNPAVSLRPIERVFGQQNYR
jgi:hypothetical protein